MQMAQANYELLENELKIKRRGELLAQRYFERTKLLVGIDPETCKAVTDPTELSILLRKQIEIIRTIGELNHCEHLVTNALQKTNTELANVPLPHYTSMPNAEKPSISSGKTMDQVFKDSYLPPSSLTTGRKEIDLLFKNPSPTEFAGYKMTQEGMHALRIFYANEPALKPQIASRLKYPLLGNETFYHYPECRIIVSGGLEITSVIQSDPQDAGHNLACAEACDNKLSEWVAEKKPAAFLMTCHHLGEVVRIRSKGTPLEQGIKQVNLESNKHATCIIRLRGGETLANFPIMYRTACYARYKEIYLNYESKLPVVSPDGVTTHILEAYIVQKYEEKIASASIKSYPLTDFKNQTTPACHAEDIIVLKNGDKTSEIRPGSSDCLEFCLADFKKFRTKSPGKDQPLPRSESSITRSWHYRCSDKVGNTLLLCSQNRLLGCR